MTSRRKPHWETLHDWWLEDFEFEYKQMWELKMLVRKHTDDSVGVKLKEMMVMVKGRVVAMVKEYEKVYGDKPKLDEIKLKVENRQEYKAYRQRMLSMVIDDYSAMEDEYYRLKGGEGT